jgi:iron complex outermembrane receptor protein
MVFQEKTGVRSVRIALSLLAGSMLAAGAVHAQQADTAAGADEKVQKVEITGSNIKRLDTETASPVQVVNRQEIIQSGATTVADILNNLTIGVTGSAYQLTDKNGSLSFAGGGTALNFRYLGKSSTLVLVNGRRISNYALADGGQENFTNVDSIPADIIDRIEILKDGASAIYGSDAIAGVVNIITLKEFKGVSLRVAGQDGLKNHKTDKDQQASVTFGYGELAKDGYNIYGHIEGYHRDSYNQRDIMNDVDPWYKKYANPSFGVLSYYSYPGNYIGQDPNTGADISGPAPGCAPANIQGGLCRFDRFKYAEVIPAADRVNFMGSGRLKIDSDTSA